jgi:hypothetical protein
MGKSHVRGWQMGVNGYAADSPCFQRWWPTPTAARRAVYSGRRAERGNEKLYRLAGHRLPSSDLIFRQHPEEAFVCRFVLVAGRLSRPWTFNQESSEISAKAAQER